MIKKMLITYFAVCFGILSINAGKKVACIGDSITFGARIKKRNTFSYPAQLARMLGSAYEVKNFGVNGSTLLRKGDRPYWNTEQYQQALKWNPDIVIIKLGSNDTKLQNWKFKDDLEKNLTDLAASFTKLKSKPTVYLAIPVPAFQSGKSIDTARVKNGIVPVVKKVAKTQKLPIIDFFSLMLGKQSLFPDKIHPNAKGALLLAAEVYKTITGKPYKRTVKGSKVSTKQTQ